MRILGNMKDTEDLILRSWVEYRNIYCPLQSPTRAMIAPGSRYEHGDRGKWGKEIFKRNLRG